MQGFNIQALSIVAEVSCIAIPHQLLAHPRDDAGAGLKLLVNCSISASGAGRNELNAQESLFSVDHGYS